MTSIAHDAKILIVDDSRMTRKAMEQILNRQGYENLFFASSAAEAFAALEADAPRAESVSSFDLILLDIIMRELDGIRACARLKEDSRFVGVPVVMVTAVDRVESLKNAFDVGAIDYITKPFHEIEIEARVASTLRLKREIDQRKRREEQLLRLTERLTEANRSLLRHALLDELTGVANRRDFNESLEDEWRRALRTGETVAVMMIDVDGFKLYNDTYGHPAGDACLKKIADLLADRVRRAGDKLARIGGEEFAVLLPRATAEGLKVVAETLRGAVEEGAIPHTTSPTGDVVTVSIGAAILAVTPAADRDLLISTADEALYRAKRGGRNRWEIADLSA